MAPPGEDRLETVSRRIVAEGREPVESDATANGVVAGLRETQRRGAIGDVTHDSVELAGELAEPLELLAREALVFLVRGRKVAHEADHAVSGSRQRLLWATCPSAPCPCPP